MASRPPECLAQGTGRPVRSGATGSGPGGPRGLRVWKELEGEEEGQEWREELASPRCPCGRVQWPRLRPARRARRPAGVGSGVDPRLSARGRDR